MSLVLLLIICLGTLVQVNLQNTSTNHNLAQARANALLGLHAALGQTQRLLGVDQRISAEANILTETLPGKEHWLGVWNSDGTGSSTWLVSGNQSHTEAWSGNEAELVGPDSSVETVRAPKEIVEHNGAPRGSYAYWVTDLSQKARVDLVHDEIANSPRQEPPLLLGAPNFGLSNMSGLDSLSPAADNSTIGDSLRNSLKKLERAENLDLIASNLKQPSRNLFFDLTTASRGLQTNVVDGGLKTDLTSALSNDPTTPVGSIYPNGPPWALLRDYIALSESVNDDSIQPSVRNPTSPSTLSKTAYPSSHGIFPLVLFWEFGFGLSMDAPSAAAAPTDPVAVRLLVEPTVVLSNPYDVSLDQETYILRITSGNSSYQAPNKYQRYPAFRASFLDPDNPSQEIDDNFITPVHGNYINRWLPDFEGTDTSSDSRFQNNGLRVSITTSFEPGEVKVFSLEGDIDIPGLGSDSSSAADDFLIELTEGEPLGHTAQSQDITPELSRTLTKEDYDDWQNDPSRLVLQSITGTVVLNLYLNSVDIDSINQSVHSQNLTATHRIITLNTLYDNPVYFGAFLKGPNDLINSERKPKSLTGSQTLAHYDVRSHHASTAIRSMSSGGDFRTAPTYSIRSDSGLNNSLYSGLGDIWDPALRDPTNGDYRMVLFHVPQDELISLAELQHANLNRNAYSPSYAIGNSLASPWVEPDATITEGDSDDFVDVSYKLNEALWDNYFFSSIPPDASEDPIPENRRYSILVSNGGTPTGSQLRDPNESSTWLITEGPFNVNSSSVEAWTALLSGLRGYVIEYDDLGTLDSETVSGGAFARSGLPSGSSLGLTTAGRADSDDHEYWRGFRNLTDTQIRNLAGQIVHQIQQRGPFLNLASFVNRDPFTTETNPVLKMKHQLKGAIQAAIDSETSVTVDDIVYGPSGINPALTATNTVGYAADESYGSNDGGPPGYNFPEAVEGGLRSSMAPGYLTQADILSQIGSLLTVRGDTFLIRAGGEASDTTTGETIATARCEAIVQRLPEYLIDPDQAPHEPASAANTPFGRSFRLIAFRWLNDNE